MPRIIMVETDNLHMYAKNAKTHPEKQIKKIEKSIEQFGFNVPVVVDKDYNIIAGHGRVLAANNLKLKEVPCIMVENLTEDQVKAYRIADNKVAESDWDFDTLKLEFEELKHKGFDLEMTGFDLKEIESLISTGKEGLNEAAEEGFIEVNAYERAKSKTKIKTGDVFLLGDHRLMCGDATKKTDVAILMQDEKADMVLTDPPYNTGMEPKNGSTRLSHMFNDNMSEDDWAIFQEKTIAINFEYLSDNVAAYFFMDWRRCDEWIMKLKNTFHYSNLIVWDKVVHGLGSDYKHTHEFIAVCKKGKPNINTHQNEEYKDIWHIQRRVGRNKEHATAKPAQLIELPIKHASNKEEIVMDLFGGSGTTLIACEKTWRKCRMMEIDPVYVQVIVDRWQKYTDKTAHKLN